MSFMFGSVCNEPRRLQEALAPVRSALVAAGPARGWGLGYIQGGEVLLRRQPRPTPGPIDFFDALQAVSSDYVIGHTSRDDGHTGNENTQPFRFRRWLFAESGGLDGFAAIQPAVIDKVPAFLRRNVRGRMAAEWLFHLVLALLQDAGAIDDPNAPPTTVLRCVRDAVLMVERLAAAASGATGPGNLIITNGRAMFALRLAEPLHVRMFKGTGVPMTKRAPEDTFRAALVVSAEAAPGEGFEQIPSRGVVSIARDLRTEVASLDAS